MSLNGNIDISVVKGSSFELMAVLYLVELIVTLSVTLTCGLLRIKDKQPRFLLLSNSTRYISATSVALVLMDTRLEIMPCHLCE